MIRVTLAGFVLVVLAIGCGGPDGRVATAPAPDGDLDPCYPYLAGDGGCPTGCVSIDDCAGSRGPDELAEKGWPLDCINGRCVPLAPETVRDPR
jgi:hypothetical protein